MSKAFIPEKDRNRIIEILKFWHKIEFFIPFDLEHRSEERDGKACFWYHHGDTRPLHGFEAPKGDEISSYQLFLGVFDKAEIANIVRTSEHLSENERLDDDERTDLEGLTCMASLKLDASAAPLFETVEVSTLPWAMGMVKAHGLSSLSHDAFADAKGKLAYNLHNFAQERRLKKDHRNNHNNHDNKNTSTLSTPLAVEEVETLFKMFCTWAGFQPDDKHPLAMLEIRFQKKHEIKPQKKKNNKSEEEDEIEIGILNSFYIEDIEYAIHCIEKGTASPALIRYLTPLAETEKIDLYSNHGQQKIYNLLHPKNLSKGRWLSEANHAMSLMQQFAINAILSDSDSPSLFAVNGPPGTGKTTLLRDIIADNIVRRAHVLAQLETADAAFGDSLEMYIGGRKRSIKTLIPQLTGYEMVVASINNTAVENISRDLPKRKAIASRDFQYLQPIAHKIAAQKKDGHFVRLKEEDQPWGLISCALGNSNNRWYFREGFFFNEINKNTRKTWAGDIAPQTIWQWRGPRIEDREKAKEKRAELHHPFKRAAETFQDIYDNVSKNIAKLEIAADLHADLFDKTKEDYCRLARQEAERSKYHFEQANNALARAERDLVLHKEHLVYLHGEKHLIDDWVKPSFFARLFDHTEWRNYKKRIKANEEDQHAREDAINKLKKDYAERLKPAASTAHHAMIDANRHYENRQGMWQTKSDTYHNAVQALGIHPSPNSLDEFEADFVQKQGLWHSDTLAQLRSDLFQAALVLHEAWLAEVSQIGGGSDQFNANISAISALLEGKMALPSAQILAIWQSLFMIIPVVSTTFASLSRQFSGIEPQSLGWLFIDEAGQAVPQAAVGALLRAKQTVVIGDPLQIEPVFTLPQRLITNLADLSSYRSVAQYSPVMTSIQTIADASNQYGVNAKNDAGEHFWIGSPLRVHRRCANPMFKLSNAIAYNNKMIFGLTETPLSDDDIHGYGESAWINIPGNVIGKQSVLEQIDFVANLLVETHKRHRRLPDLYVISPFKEIKGNLIQAMKKEEWWMQHDCSPPKDLKGWLKSHIGTVHTFQGKEEHSVIMVLGADTAHEGAVRWASQKPNLLNVAMTRAKRRFYIVGAIKLWGAKPYFHDAAHELPHVSATTFMENYRKRG